MREFQIASPILVLIIVGLALLFMPSAISVIARTFCLASVVVFAGTALFGLASKLRD